MSVQKDHDVQDFEREIRAVEAQLGNYFNRHLQAGTDITKLNGDMLIDMASRRKNVNFEQAKGNLFEYIESAKLEQNMANAGKGTLKYRPVTDAKAKWGGRQRPHDPADFVIAHQGKVTRGQAKYNNSARKAAENLANPKYANMQRVVPVDQVPAVRQAILDMKAKGQISAKAADDALANLSANGLTDKATGISSGGTTTKEIQELKGKNGKISQAKVKRRVEKTNSKQYRLEIEGGIKNGAKSAALMTGVIESVTNFAAFVNGKKDLATAVKDAGKNTAKAAAYGGASGGLSAWIRTLAVDGKIPSILKKGDMAVVLANGVIDSGIAIWKYIDGKISSRELAGELQGTAVNAAATIYFTEATQMALGATNLFVPMAVYTVASFVVSNTRAVIRQHQLNAEKYNKLADLYEEAAAAMDVYRQQLEAELGTYIAKKSYMLQYFMNNVDSCMRNGENSERLIAVLSCFATNLGTELKYAKFSEFAAMMQSDEVDVIE